MKTITTKEIRTILKENGIKAKVKENNYNKMPVLFPTTKIMYNKMLDLLNEKYFISFDMFLMDT